MSFAKKILISVAVTAITGAVMARNKVNQAIDILNSLVFEIDRINDAKFGLLKSSLNVDLSLINMSSIPFSAETGTILTIKKFDFYNKKGVLFAEAFKTINSVNLPANSKTIIKDIDVKFDNFKLINSLDSIKSKDGIKVKVHVIVFGKPYII